MRRALRLLVAGALTLLSVGLAAHSPSAQPADDSAAAIDSYLATFSGPRVGPSYIYPDPKLTPGLVNPDITQATIGQTICNPQWSTKSIRQPVTYTNNLKTKQLASGKTKDKNPSHYEEDHFISLEIGGNPTDPRNLWPEPWGTPATPLTSTGPFPAHLVGAKTKDAVENQLHKEVCAGRLTLRQAQEIIATDWFKYYRDHVLKP